MNQLFSMHRSPWRIVNGESILIDSEYLHTEVQARTLRLLKEGQSFGALEEFHEAVHSLQAGDTKNAVVNAHKSVESVMKTVLRTSDHLTFGRLLADLISSGIVPTYYEEFLRHFEQLALGVVKQRNQPGTGHGQGASTLEVPRSLAELAVNLAGSINLFLIQRWIELHPRPHNRELSIDDDDVPF